MFNLFGPFLIEDFSFFQSVIPPYKRGVSLVFFKLV